jgi:hypothetical protein
MATSSSTRRGRQSGVDLKPPQAAVVKSHGGERCGNVGRQSVGRRDKPIAEVELALDLGVSQEGSCATYEEWLC